MSILMHFWPRVLMLSFLSLTTRFFPIYVLCFKNKSIGRSGFEIFFTTYSAYLWRRRSGEKRKEKKFGLRKKLFFSHSWKKQGQIHGYPSRVRLGRGCFWVHLITWAGAMRSKIAKAKKSVFSSVYSKPRLVCLSHFYFFNDFYSLILLLLPKGSSDLKYGPCPPARDFGSRVSSLVLYLCR